MMSAILSWRGKNGIRPRVTRECTISISISDKAPSISTPTITRPWKRFLLGPGSLRLRELHLILPVDSELYNGPGTLYIQAYKGRTKL